jgi:hypothetical protein
MCYKAFNSIHANIKFTMETEQDKTLLFHDVLIKKMSDDPFGHTVYRKLNTYVPSQHAEPEQHPAQKLALLSILIYCVRSICDADSLEEETEHLKKNLCSNQDIRQALEEVLNIEPIVPVCIYLMVSVSYRFRALVSK